MCLLMEYGQSLLIVWGGRRNPLGGRAHVKGHGAGEAVCFSEKDGTWTVEVKYDDGMKYWRHPAQVRAEEERHICRGGRRVHTV